MDVSSNILKILLEIIKLNFTDMKINSERMEWHKQIEKLSGKCEYSLIILPGEKL